MKLNATCRNLVLGLSLSLGFCAFTNYAFANENINISNLDFSGPGADHFGPGGPGFGHGPNHGGPGHGGPGPGPGFPGNYGISYGEAQSLVTLLYQAILFRYPDSGDAGWIDQVQRGGFNGLVASAQGIADSYEFHSQVTSRYNATQIVINAYRVLLNRYPDPGANNWVRLISQGQSGQAFAGIVGSDEFRRLHNL